MFRCLERLKWVVLSLAGAGVYALQSAAWPLAPGRDYTTYLVYFFDLLNPYPSYHLLMVFRTPAAPLFWGVLMTWASPWVAELTMGVLFAVALLLVHAIAGHWGRSVAWIASALFLCNSAHAWLYHVASSEALCAFATLGWIAMVVRTYRCRAPAWWFVLHGLLVFLLAMIRPASQLYVPLFALTPFFFCRCPLARRAVRAGVFLGTTVPLLLLFSWYNYVRYDDFTVSRTGAFCVPFQRLFLEGLIDPENGPASQELTAAIEDHLVKSEPYRSCHIDLQTILHGKPWSRRTRIAHDMVPLADQVWGWDSDYRILRQVVHEAMIHRPLDCTRVFAMSMVRMLSLKPEYPAPRTPRAPDPSTNTLAVAVDPEGQFIPRCRFQWTKSSPYVRLENPVERDTSALDRKIAERIPELPVRDGSDRVAGGFNFLMTALPGMDAWVFLGVLGFLVRPHSRRWFGLFLLGLVLAVPILSYVGSCDVVEYRTVYDPLLIVLGLAGIWGGADGETAHEDPLI